MNFDYLMNQKVSNLKGETGIVTGVENTPDGNGTLHVAFESGRTARFKFLSQGSYVTKFLTFTDPSTAEKIANDVEEHKNRVSQSDDTAERSTPSEPESAQAVPAPEEEVIRFGKTHELYGGFSNFAGPTFYDGRQYKCSEAAWQSMKSMDPEERDLFIPLAGGAAKAKGRKVKLRADWEQVKDQLMVEVCYAKFSQNPDLKELLLETGDKVLVENTTGWHDNYWGDCQCARCKNKPGLNHLGLALMRVRSMLREENNQ